MEKTTVYLPAELKDAIAREARALGVAEAEVIRRALTGSLVRPAPRPGIIQGMKPIADRVDELLEGFGER